MTLQSLPEVQYVTAWLTLAINDARTRPDPATLRGTGLPGPGAACAARGRDERGEVAQTVIIVAILAAAAITIATIIAVKFTDKAQTIPSG